ncbi:amidohydrolase 2 [Aspergillus pseudoustus]|uniref:6-methylsalicylate decarboxylase n=1 Tax=Aspergillus pseudoustus TaxID=1810923 RepID=A0ABR4KBB1_9EURO
MAPLKIDTHQHVFPSMLRKAMADNPHLSVGLPNPTWTPQETLAFMASNDIEISILSCALPLTVLAQGNVVKAASLTREVNEYLASLRTQHPTKLGFFASLPSLEDTDRCIEEIQYAFDELRADGVLLFTSYNNKYLGHPDFEPIWRELNTRVAVVFTHPTIEGARENSIHEPFTIPPPLLDWTHETSRAAVHLILTNSLRRFPECKIILSHGGGTLPFIAGRMAALQTPLCGKSETEFLGDARRFYYDIALVGPPTTPLQLVLEFADEGHVLYGSDFPFLAAEAVAGRWGLIGDEELLFKTGTAAQVLFPRFAD